MFKARGCEALTGRVHLLTVWPWSQGQIDGVVEDFLAAFRSDAAACVRALPSSDTTRAEYAETCVSSSDSAIASSCATC